jgi:hypothetical protein
MLTALSFSLESAYAWGRVGHRYIHYLAIEALPEDLKAIYAANREWIIQHSIDPDEWRRGNPAEGPNHFIDLDFKGLDAARTFPEDYWVACGLYGKAEIDKNGVVPWRIGQYYAKLVRAFREQNPRAIVEISTFLGHYVADIHVPFHACLNYDGQLTGQKGIHARFESVLLERQIALTDLKVRSGRIIKTPVKSAFQWARESLKLSFEVLEADKQAAAQDAQYGEVYYTAFGKRARPIAIRRLEEAGRALASLWRSAWEEAGRPALATVEVHAGEPLDAPTRDPDLPAATERK